MRINKSVILVIVASIVSLYFYKIYTDKNALEKAQLEQKNKIQEQHKVHIAKMVDDYNAIDWENNLVEKYKKGIIKLYSYELQNLWMSGRPILFIGSIEDISNYNDKMYLLRIKRHFTLRRLPISIPGHGLELSLLAQKSFIDKQLYSAESQNNKRHKKVAVIADIKSIDTKSVRYEDSESEVFTGYGNLLNIYFFSGSI